MESNVSFIPYESLGITAAVIAVALAFIVLTWNAVKAIGEWRQSLGKQTAEAIEDHEQRISYLEGCCKEVHGKLKSDWEWQQASAETNKLILKSIKQLLKHSIDGNDKDGLQLMEDAIDNYLVEHQK